MSVLEEVKQKRDYGQSRKDAGEQGYDPAIDFYNRIIKQMEEDHFKIGRYGQEIIHLNLQLKSLRDGI